MVAKKGTKNLSPTSTKALDEFKEAAMQWGWQRDQGYGNSIKMAEERFNETYENLRKRMLRLEQASSDAKRNLALILESRGENK